MSNLIKEQKIAELSFAVETVTYPEFRTRPVQAIDVEPEVVVPEVPPQPSFDEERLSVAQMVAEAEGQLRRSRIAAQRLLSEAEQKVADMLKDAEQKIEQFRKEGLEKGYSEGLVKAEKEMDEKYQAVTDQELSQIKKLIEGFMQSYTGALKNAEHALVKLAMEIATKVIKEEAERNNEVVIKMVREGLERVVEKANVMVRVHPSQLQIVKRSKDKLVAMVESIDHFELLADPRIDKGGCVVDTGSGSVEVRLDKQINEIKKALTGEDVEEAEVPESQQEDLSADNVPTATAAAEESAASSVAAGPKEEKPARAGHHAGAHKKAEHHAHKKAHHTVHHKKHR